MAGFNFLIQNFNVFQYSLVGVIGGLWQTSACLVLEWRILCDFFEWYE